jgi:glucose-6-phosphate 1-epimerase
MAAPGELSLVSGRGDTARVSLFGAHVLSWKPADADEQLYLSPRSHRDEKRAIRGGIPVIFPRFELRPPHVALPRHGFARTSVFTLLQHTGSGDEAAVELALRAAPEAVTFEQPFALTVRVALAHRALTVALEVHNTGTEPLPIGAALHTYLAVSEVERVALTGLEGVDFWDSAHGRDAPGSPEPLRIQGELDRIYRAAPALLLRDGDRTLHVTSSGFSDTVVWNPGTTKARALDDLPHGDEARFLCVEAAQALTPWTLAPGARHTAAQQLRLA